ncbi:hypothetical protein QU481_02750 [Crenobacter sp. SG2303]|uniref:Uncharacterized protein n=1 Tax=Crenobacter oryzisoli TaxID=3056844 RepID=A0ABT7XJ63_9NEIS|nr:hypothetical protein [Crenobacter sp. SG2303]MDN0073810.1 hypothetical protein [Crenobacter sp. SG2303]
MAVKQTQKLIQKLGPLIGKMGVDTAKKLIDGQKVEKSIPVPLELVKQ